MAFYDKDMFSEFKGGLLVGSLKFRELYHIQLENGLPVSEQAYLKRKIGRIRDVAVASDGSILLLSDEANGGVYRLYRKTGPRGNGCYFKPCRLAISDINVSCSWLKRASGCCPLMRAPNGSSAVMAEPLIVCSTAWPQKGTCASE